MWEPEPCCHQAVQVSALEMVQMLEEKTFVLHCWWLLGSGLLVSWPWVP